MVKKNVSKGIKRYMYQEMQRKRTFLEKLRHINYTFVVHRKNLSLVAFGFLFVYNIINIYTLQENHARVLVPDFIKEEHYPPFEPDLQEDFQTGSDFEPRIPHILHQTYRNTYLPWKHVLNIKRFLEYNSDWKYFLWTEKSAWKFIIKRYPSLLGTLTLQMKFEDLSKILRYAILYEFGGVYADVSIKWLREIQNMTLKYSCIFTTLPFERASLGFKRPFLLNNDLIFCRAKHPFLKQIIGAIPIYQPMTETEDEIGFHFVTSQFIKYNGQHYNMRLSNHYKENYNSPYFYKSSLPETHEDAVFIPNSKYFSVDLKEFYGVCEDFMQLSFIEKRGCVALKKRRGISNFAFTKVSPIKEHVLGFLYRTEISSIAGNYLYTDVDDLENETSIS